MLAGMDGLADVVIRIDYADMAKMNRIRAWAKKNGAVVNVNRYARDAYDGHIKIRSPWNEGRDVAQAKAAEFKVLFGR